jgi:hypothetical protein
MLHLLVCGLGIVVNTVSMGHITSLDWPQKGQSAIHDSSFALLEGPKILNVLRLFLQVMIFSIAAPARFLNRDCR